ncbi:shikimate dehydrogenase [Ornithinimicrobium cerasi]|uniref:shikimate dehydrogenase n=1 Tax=Ornithinimicrobium cerasi TaxID=2248773 RepID=UPI00301DD33F
MVRGQPRPVLSAPAAARRAAVVGSPVAHSLSPVLHLAAYDALGLTGWSYDRQDVPAGGLADHVARLGPEWAGLSVTAPGKEEALALAEGSGTSARMTGAANTLLRTPTGWWAENTDVAGLRAALVEAGAPSVRRAIVVGGGATARSALLALAQLGATEVTLLLRDRPRRRTQDLVARLDMSVPVRRLADGALDLGAAGVDVVVSTLPADAPAPRLRLGDEDPSVVMDVVYAPWPSPFARAVGALGPEAPSVVRGTGMLLHQAVRQVELMTGQNGPVEAMRAALAAAGGPG